MPRNFVAPVFVLCAFASAALTEDAVTPAYESAPTFAAKDVVPAPVLVSENYTITENVSIANYYYHFQIASPIHGTYEVDSTDLLMVRIFELGVLAKVTAVKGGDSFAKGAKTNLTDTAKAAAKTIVTPVKSAKALGASLEDTGRAAFDFVRMKKRNQPDDSLLTGDEKRKDAHILGLDVYSTNPAVQDYLDELAKARATGSRLVDVTLSVGTFVMPFGTPVSAAITAGQYREKLADKLDTMSPMELYRYNDKILKKMDVESRDREAFLEFANLTPKQKTEIAADLKTLENMKQKAPFLYACIEAHPANGAWQVQSADVLAKYNKAVEPIEFASSAGAALIFLTTGGKQAVVFPGDVVYWSEDVQKALDKSNAYAGVTQREFVTPGGVTERAKKELESRGFLVRGKFLNEPAEEAKATR